MPGQTVAYARPGDTIIVAVPEFLTEEDLQHLTEAWKPLIALGVHIAFMESVTGLVVVKGKLS